MEFESQGAAGEPSLQIDLPPRPICGYLPPPFGGPALRILIVATNREKTPIPVAPIGACTIATVLSEAGHDVHFVDLMWSRDPKKELRRAVETARPELIGLSIRNMDNTSWMNNVWYLDDARDYVTIAREASGVPIMVGGPAVGVAPGPVTDYVGADWGIWGDGERGVVELAACLARGDDPSDLRGVVKPHGLGTGLHRVNEQYRVEEMGEIPNHRMWDWLDFRPYARHAAPLQIQSRRGCAFKCTYCNYPQIEGGSYRSKPTDKVVDEIAAMARGFPGVAIEFVDNTFNVPLPYALKLCDALIERKLDVTLHTNGFNPRATTPALMEKMHHAGFRQVMITPEVANDAMLTRMQKGFTMRHLRESVENRKHLFTIPSPMEFLWVFLLGGPGETKETMLETFRFIREEIPSKDMIFVQVGLRVYPNTPLQQEAIQEGVITADNELLKSFHYVSPALEPMWIYDTIMENIRGRSNITTRQGRDVFGLPLLPAPRRRAGHEGAGHVRAEGPEADEHVGAAERRAGVTLSGLHVVEHGFDQRVRADALSFPFEVPQDAMPQRHARDALHVGDADVLSLFEEGLDPCPQEQRLGAPGARPVADVAPGHLWCFGVVRVGRQHQANRVVDQLLFRQDLPGEAAHRQERRPVAHRADLGLQVRGRAQEDRAQFVERREGHVDLEEETVELRFGERVGPVHLQGVLRRDYEEGLR